PVAKSPHLRKKASCKIANLGIAIVSAKLFRCQMNPFLFHFLHERTEAMKRLLSTMTVIPLLAGMANASSITTNSINVSLLPGTNTSFATSADYVTNWNNQVLAYPSGAPGYGVAPVTTWDYPVQGNVDNHELIPGGSSSEIAYHYQISFSSGAGTFDFRIAPD